MQHLVSIIIPCYNADPYIRAAIQSALDQHYTSCEVIVIDDGSTDGSLEVIRSFGDRVHWQTGPNRGGCVARNLGLHLAKGQFIQFLDADDRISPDKIASQIAALEVAPSPESLAICPWRYFEGDRLGPLVPLDQLSSPQIGTEFLIHMWTHGTMFPPHVWLTPRSLIDRVGGWNESLIADQDGEFFGRLLVAAEWVVQSEGGEAHYRRPIQGNVSQQQSVRAFESRLEAWKMVAGDLKNKVNHGAANKAIRRRLQGTVYGGMNYYKLVEPYLKIAPTGLFWDWNPRAPRFYNTLCGLLGISLGFSLVRRLKQRS